METDSNRSGDDTALSGEGPQHVGRTALKRAHSHTGYHAGKKMIVLFVVLLVFIVGGGASYWYWAGKPHVDENKNINTKEYQALFLTNGQVYFGKLADLNDSKYVTMTDIFYLQVQQNLQQATATANSTGGQVSLAKLGNELHGPEDKMMIATDQVLFWENLKNNSKVVQAIDKYQSQ